MREAGWSARRVACQLGRSDCVVRRCWDQWILPSTPTRQCLHLEWCRARGNWTAAEWNQVVFSDESRFNLSSDDNRFRVWRPRGERLNLPLLYSDTPLPQLVGWYGVRCLQYTVTPSIDPCHHDSPVVCP
ncbi:uncharacterized protein TNCV_2477601 [Trichonephila clavipes]|nr:uncharacterized protein TNCV_2477601 [Trichonephila clavipes]